MATRASESPDLSDDQVSKKRKRSEDAIRKKSKRTKSKRVDDAFGDLDETNNLNLAFSKLDPNLLGDHLAQKQKRFESDATIVELEERRIPVSIIKDTTEWTEIRSREKLPAFLKHFATTDLKKAPKDTGSPHTIVIAGAGLRAADLARTLREFQMKDAKVAKLFAKHIKISESIEMLQKSRISVGVGTPARLSALLDNGALKADKLKRLVVDASHIDQKKRGILDMQETIVPLLTLLNRPDFKNRLMDTNDDLSLMFY